MSKAVSKTGNGYFKSKTMQKVVIKSQTVELTVPAGSTATRFKFTNQPFLAGKRINSISIFSTNDFTASPLGNILPTEANLKTAYLTLYGDDPDNPGNQGTWLADVPMWEMHNLNNGVDPFTYDKYEMEPRVIIWEQSYVTVNAAITPGSQLSFLFNVGYQD